MSNTDSLLECLFETSLTLVAYMDTRFNFIRVNRKYAEADDRSPEFFVGKNHFDLYPNKESQEIFQKVVESGEPYFTSAKPFEYAHNPERELILWDWSLLPVNDGQGKVKGLLLSLINVTEHVQNSGRMMQEARNLSTVMEMTNDGILINVDGCHIYTNQCFADMLGYEISEVLAASIHDLVHPDDLEKVLKRYRRCLAGEDETDQYEVSFRKKDGSSLIAEVTTTLVNWDDKTATMIAVRDITEQRRINRELQENKDRFDLAVQGSTAGIWDWDITRNEVFYSDRLMELLGCKHKDTRNSFGLFEEWLHPDDKSRVLTAIRNHLEKHEPYDIEYRLKNSEGEYHWFWARGQAIWNESDKPLRMVGSITDITDRKLNEEQVQKNEIRIAGIIDVSRDGIISIDRSNRIILFNRGAEEIFGYQREEALGQSLALLLPDSEKGKHYSRIEAFQQSGDTARTMGERQTVQGRRKNGELFPMEAGISILELAGETIFTAVIRDMSAWIHAENELIEHREHLEELVGQRTEALAAANKELEAFSYSVSHDLRAPLRSIDGFSQVLLEDYVDRLDESGQDYLHRIRNASQRMGELIGNLLLLSRMTRNEMRVRTVDLSTMAQQALDDLIPEDKQQAFEITIEPDIQVNGDPNLLRVMFDNLLSNAVKFTSQSQNPSIEFGRKESSWETIYYIRDNGAGFDMRYIDKLFTPFQRLHNARTFPGTGIGLATVQRVINRHGGRIWAKSEIDKGTTFFFSFPGNQPGNPETTENGLSNKNTARAGER